MSKVKTIEEVVAKLHDGATVFLGGFLGVGAPLKCIDAIAASGVKDLTLMSEVSGMPGGGFDMAILFKKPAGEKNHYLAYWHLSGTAGRI